MTPVDSYNLLYYAFCLKVIFSSRIGGRIWLNLPGRQRRYRAPDGGDGWAIGRMEQMCVVSVAHDPTT